MMLVPNRAQVASIVVGLSLLVGCAGSKGADGATGPAGPAGANGTNGVAGPAGPAGAAGAAGADGAAGPQGISGVVNTLYVNNAVVSAAFVGSTFQYLCKTTAYVAGTGERAIFNVQASATVPAGSGIGVRPGYNVNAGVDTNIGSWHYQKNNGTGAAGVTNGMSGVLALTAGSTYIFSVATNDSEGIGFPATTVFCNTLVTIVKI
jgi:hypothetical protein